MCILTYDDVTLPGGYGHPVGLIEARNQSWKPQGPVGLFRVHWVSLGCDPCKQ